MKSRIPSKVTVLALAVVMILGIGAVAFAAEGDFVTLDTRLYKDGQFDPARPDDNLSMGDGAVLDTTYVEKADGNYKVTVRFAESFSAYGLTGHLTDVKIDVNNDGDFTNDGVKLQFASSGAVVGAEFVQPSIPTTHKLFKGQFTINIEIMPINANGDLVIFR